MYSLFSISSEKQLEEQKILKNLNNDLTNEQLRDVMIENNNEKLNQVDNISQINISQHTENDRNIQETKDNQENYNSKDEIKLENRVIKKEHENNNFSLDEDYDRSLLKENIIIKNSYKLTLDLFNTIKHINESEYLLKKHNKLLNKAMQDILHKIESDKFNVVEGYKLAKKIQIIRNEKKLIRENLAIYRQLNCLELFNEDTINKLNEIIDGVKKEENIIYEPKILKDLNFRYDNEKIYNKYDDIRKENFINLGIKDF